MRALFVAALVALSIARVHAVELWDLTVTSFAYNFISDEYGFETARYRYNPDDLILTSTGDPNSFEGLTYYVSGPILNYHYEGIDDGAGGASYISGYGHGWFRSIFFGGTQLGNYFQPQLFVDPEEFSGLFSLINNFEGTPLYGGEGDFSWVGDPANYFISHDLPVIPELTRMLVTLSPVAVPEPGTLALLGLALLPLAWRLRRA
jgi:hypothetical protein